MGSDHQSNRWDQLHEELKCTLQKEIFLMRELLANLHQEELSMMMQDHGTYSQLAKQKSDMMERLSHLRTHRERTAEKIFAIAEKQKKDASWEDLLSEMGDASCEILNLRDQLMALTEKMNRQQSRNQHLTDHPDYLLSLQHQEKLRQQKDRPKRKPTVATYQIKK